MVTSLVSIGNSRITISPGKVSIELNHEMKYLVSAPFEVLKDSALKDWIFEVSLILIIPPNP